MELKRVTKYVITGLTGVWTSAVAFAAERDFSAIGDSDAVMDQGKSIVNNLFEYAMYFVWVFLTWKAISLGIAATKTEDDFEKSAFKKKATWFFIGWIIVTAVNSYLLLN